MDINEKKIEKASRKIDLSGFKMQDELNPKIWDENQKMKPEVRKNLLKIADDFFESLEIPDVDIEDVFLMGSLANYNWSKYSDVDLHILIDYKDVPVDEDLILDFFKAKTFKWSQEHDITIYGYDVELYVQNIGEEYHSEGVYSILKNEWVSEPTKRKITIKSNSIKNKASQLMDRIEGLYDLLSDEDDYEKVISGVDKLKNKIKRMRQSGLESGGEFSIENMVFKVLRRNGMLDRLYDIKTVAYDKSLTLESKELNTLLESMTNDDLNWMKEINPTPIKNDIEGDHGKEYEIILDYFRKNGVQRYGKWKYNTDTMSGSVEWWQDGENEILFFATPFWNGELILPIDYQADMGDYDSVEIIDLPQFYYEEELIEWLENKYPKIVSKNIEEFMGDLGPLPE